MSQYMASKIWSIRLLLFPRPRFVAATLFSGEIPRSAIYIFDVASSTPLMLLVRNLPLTRDLRPVWFSPPLLRTLLALRPSFMRLTPASGESVPSSGCADGTIVYAASRWPVLPKSQGQSTRVLTWQSSAKRWAGTFWRGNFAASIGGPSRALWGVGRVIL